MNINKKYKYFKRRRGSNEYLPKENQILQEIVHKNKDICK